MNWLFLRGLVREQRHWGVFPKVFAEKLGVKVHFLDLPGAGTENTRPSPYTIRGILADLHERFQKIPQDGQDWSLMTTSLGSMIGLQWVHLYPAEFKRLVAMNGSAGNLSFPHERLNYKILLNALKTVGMKDAVQRERTILQMTTNMQKLDEKSKEWAEIGQSAPVKRLLVLQQIAAAIAFSAPEKISVPALFLVGAKDNFVNPSCSQELANFYKAPLLIHPEAGHDLSTDDPEWVSKVVKTWVEAQAI